MKIEQFYDEALAHASYAILADQKIALVDPGRDTKPYLEYAEKNQATIEMVLETHPHADFVSSHQEWIEKHNVKVYINPEVGVSYKFSPLSHEDEIKLGELTFRTLFTPGHSPDHNSYLLLDRDHNEVAVFTGDSLFVGDVGRPDLREGAGNLKKSKKELAKMMFSTVNDVFAKLSEGVKVYPAHGPGSLCGKNMSPDRSSTIGKEKKENWAFQISEEDAFVSSFLEGQAFIPLYFPYDVEVNRKGADPLKESIGKIPLLTNSDEIPAAATIIDVRDQQEFKKGHINGAFNIQLGGESSKFETWVGSILKPDEKFYLIAGNREQMNQAANRVAKIGYEGNVQGMTFQVNGDLKQNTEIDLSNFKTNPSEYTIIDVRNESETQEGKIFKNAINIPLPELRNRVGEIPADKPVVVHCAGGYRSAAASSIIDSNISATVLDLSEAVKSFQS